MTGKNFALVKTEVLSKQTGRGTCYESPGEVGESTILGEARKGGLLFETGIRW